MDRRGSEWLGAATGIAFFVVLIISFIVAGDEPPEAKDGAQKVVDFYTDNKDSVEAGAGISAVAAILFAFFAGYLRKVLRAAEGEGGWLSLVAFGGGLVVAISAGIDNTFTLTAAEAADDGLDPVLVQTVQAIFENDFIPFVIGVLVLEFAAGLSIVQYRALPVWLGWVAIVLGLCGVVGLVTLSEVGFISVIGGAIWVLIVSIVMTMRARSGGEAPAAPAAA
jgi:hypothetical protein